MTRKFSLVIEGDPTGYRACVPELPTILVTGRSVEEPTASPQRSPLLTILLVRFLTD